MSMMKSSLPVMRMILWLSVFAGFSVLLFFAATAVEAQNETGPSLNCTACHQVALERHDKLGEGNDACQTCHDNTNMFQFKLFDGTRIALSEPNQVCRQCHGARYAEWEAGTHGSPGTVASGNCVDCHDPHAPRIPSPGVPEPQPSPIPPPAPQQLDCTACHQVDLERHDKLGEGTAACWSCHDDTDMFQLKVANGTIIGLSQSNLICGQCHETRYGAWKAGTHGFPGTVASGNCVDCHDPHAPQMSFTGITKPHPAPAPPPPAVPVDTLMIGVVVLVFMLGLGVVIAGRRPTL